MTSINLQNWKITLPIDQSGGFGGTAYEVTNPTSYTRVPYFYSANDGALVFNAPVQGATTSGSSYARSELREMSGTAKAAWNLSQGGVMTATLEVDQAPVKNDGSLGRLVVGQIHGKDHELVRLYWDKGTVYFMNDRAGPSNTETKFAFANSTGQAPDISLNEKFSYKIDARGSALKVDIVADGQVYSSSTVISSVWQSDLLYFKAGVYLGVNEGSGSGSGQTSFYALQVSHTNSAPLPPTVPTTSTPVPPTVPTTVQTKEIKGTSGNDILTGTAANETMRGYSGNDVLRGQAGKDILWGNGGNDGLTGGTGADWMKGGDGRDTYTFSAGHGRDTIHEFRSGETLAFGSGMFASAEAVRAAMKVTSSGVLLKTGVDSSILFTGSTLSQVKNAIITVPTVTAAAAAQAAPASGAPAEESVVAYSPKLKADAGSGFDILTTGGSTARIDLTRSKLKDFEALASTGNGTEKVKLSLSKVAAESDGAAKAAFTAILGGDAGDAISLTGKGWTFDEQVRYDRSSPADGLDLDDLARIAQTQGGNVDDLAKEMNGFIFHNGDQTVTLWTDLFAKSLSVNGTSLDHLV
jgi:hypothetical protein